MRKYLSKGISYIQTAVVVLCLSMLISAILTYGSMMTIIETNQENTERVLDGYITQNSIEIFGSIKTGSDVTPYLNQKAFLEAYLLENPLDFSGEMLYSIGKDGQTVYSMTLPVVAYTVQNTLKLQVSYDLLLPVSFAGKHLFDLKVPMAVKSNYELK